MNPFPKTKTRRRVLVTKARKALATYVALTEPRYFDADAADDRRVARLCWAIALLEQALHLETRGTLGDQYATGATVQRREQALADTYRTMGDIHRPTH